MSVIINSNGRGGVSVDSTNNRVIVKSPKGSVIVRGTGTQGADGVINWGVLNSLQGLIDTLSNKVDKDYTNYLVFNSTNAIEIDYNNFRNLPNVDIYLSNNSGGFDRCEPIIDYQFNLKKININFDGVDETGFVIFS